MISEVTGGNDMNAGKLVKKTTNEVVYIRKGNVDVNGQKTIQMTTPGSQVCSLTHHMQENIKP